MPERLLYRDLEELSSRVMSRKRYLISWSGGKDCCLALHTVYSQQQIDGLLCTVGASSNRLAIHGVHRLLIEEQARALGLELIALPVNEGASNYEYESVLANWLSSYRYEETISIVFGDLHLTDIRRYREQLCSRLGIEATFPIWNSASSENFLKLGYRAIVCSIDASRLDSSFAGREFDWDFLADLPEGIDPAGENGEFHTFVYDGPLFSHPVKAQKHGVYLDRGHYISNLGVL